MNIRTKASPVDLDRSQLACGVKTRDSFHHLLLLALRVAEIVLESSGVEFGVDSVNLLQIHVDVEGDHSQDWQQGRNRHLRILDSGCVPTPRDLVAAVEFGEGRNHW